MKRWDRETWFEIGMLALAGGILGAIGVLVYGQAAESVVHSPKRRQGPPAPGSVSNERHMNIQTNPAR